MVMSMAVKAQYIQKQIIRTNYVSFICYYNSRGMKCVAQTVRKTHILFNISSFALVMEVLLHLLQRKKIFKIRVFTSIILINGHHSIYLCLRAASQT